MTTKANKKPPGRPKKPEGEKLEQFSIRLSPKLKFGLELLARLQGRSLSQTIEWALQYALVNMPSYEAGDAKRAPSIWTVLDRAWPADGWSRTFSIYSHNPMLVTFNERHACGLIERSMEYQYLVRLATSDNKADVGAYLDLIIHWNRIVDWIWFALLEDADTMTISGRQATGEPVPLIADFGYLAPDEYGLPIDKLLRKVADTLSDLRKLGVRDSTHHDQVVESPDDVEFQLAVNRLTSQTAKRS